MNCGDCTFCCKKTLVFILPDDDYPYETTQEEGLEVLAQKPNGDCIYLDNGCSIYKSRPLMCKAYFCIDFYRAAVKNNYTAIVNNKEFTAVVHAAIERNSE